MSVCRWFRAVSWMCLLGAGQVCAAPAGPRAALDAVFAHPDFRRAVWACAVTDARTGAVVYERRADEPVIPASNQKLYTAAAAWLKAGPDDRAFTEYWRRGPLRDGVLDGDLEIRGFGAFCLTARFPRSRDVRERARALETQLDGVAGRLRTAGVREIRGRVTGDRSHWTDMPANPLYRSADALLFHDNTLDVLVTNGVVACCPSRLVGFTVERTPLVRRQERVMGASGPTDTIRVNPSVPDLDYWRLEAADPCAYYATQVRAALEARGIRVGGGDVPEATGEAQRLFRLPGLSLRELLPAMLTHSDNLRAEMVLLNLGYAAYGRASYANGTRACLEVLRERGLVGAAFRPADGCGLSLDNRVTCRDTVRLLTVMAAQSEGAAFREAMAIGGQTGTLDGRLKKDALKGRIQGKSGTLSSVAALSGYAQTASGRTVCFSFVCNRIPDANRCWRAMEDALAILCADSAGAPAPVMHTRPAGTGR